MLDTILGLISQFWESVTPFKIVNQFEGGAVLRLGIYHRDAIPGVCWKWPVIEEVHLTNIVPTTLQLQAQTLTTKDDKSVVVSAIVKYEITDPAKFLLSVWDSTDVINDVTLGAVKQTVSETDYTDLNSPEIEKAVKAEASKQVKKHGVRLITVTFADLGRMKSLRIISDGYTPDP